jgi:CRISPR-associated protein Csb2
MLVNPERTCAIKRNPSVNCDFALKLLFAEPVWGPICLGYDLHFGLGLLRIIG